MNAKKVALSVFVMWSSLAGTIALADDTTTDVITPAALKRNGAQKLSVCFADATGDAPQQAWLEGLTNDKVMWKKPLPLKAQVNPAKTDVICRNGKLDVVSQYPGSAAYTKQTFTWDGNKALFLSKSDGDPSQEQVDKLKEIAVSGTQNQLDDFANEEHAVFYPANYINVDNVKALLEAGRKKSLALLAAHKPQLAAQRMQVCLNASMELCYLEGMEGEKKTTPAKWIEAWQIDEIGLPDTVWKPILKDYATILKAAGRAKESARMLKAAS